MPHVVAAFLFNILLILDILLYGKLMLIEKSGDSLFLFFISFLYLIVNLAKNAYVNNIKYYINNKYWG
jgi:hypothetical protein